MKLIFKINYILQNGDKVFLKSRFLEDFEGEKTLEMVSVYSENLEASLSVNKKKVFSLEYFFYVKKIDGTIINEWGSHRNLTIHPNWAEEITIKNQWKSQNNILNIFYTTPFVEVFSKGVKNKKRYFAYKKSVNHIFNLRLPFDTSGMSVCILGSIDELGNWDMHKALELTKISEDKYTIAINIPFNKQVIEYKYGLYDNKTKAVVELEAGDNRYISSRKIRDKSKKIINDENFFREFNKWKAAGVSIPVFSLRSKNSLGVGEFLDLKLLVDWASETGMKLIQILPVNDTIATNTWVDSYPYAAISVFALHPIYLNLDRLSKLASKGVKSKITRFRNKLNKNTTVDYEEVMKVKLAIISQIYSEYKKNIDKDIEFISFVKRNADWIKDYATFSLLRDIHGTADFAKWGKHSKYSKKIIKEVEQTHPYELGKYYFIQYHLHLQLLEAKEYAKENNIIIKGDIPIGIYKHSVDAWTTPKLFNMDMQAGAPPDGFTPKGQNWGFPTYNWGEMAKDNYLWWTKRLQKMSNYFDSFRIDHILGFFRIWQMPQHAVEGILGYFSPALSIKKEEFIFRGLNFDAERYSKPYISELVLEQNFVDKKKYVKKIFLLSDGVGMYKMKEKFDTQKKVETYFIKNRNKYTSEEQYILKNGLYNLISEVIFIEVYEGGKKTYHPRHSLQNTYSYKALYDVDKKIVDEIYNDYFYVRQEEYWRKSAMEKLPIIKKATNMLVCGEDLGMVPSVVPSVMDELGILSLEVQRMPKAMGMEFSHPNNAPYLSVVTSSSHDTSTIRGWWEEDAERSQRFYNNILWHNGTSPKIANSHLVRDIVAQHLYSPAIFAILPIQDFLGMDENLRLKDVKAEQINIPAVIPHYWNYRLHINMEKLINENKFNAKLKSMIKDAKR